MADISGNKKIIIELSRYATNNYDNSYQWSYFGTGLYMEYEMEIIRDCMRNMIRSFDALDIGCGTGRVAFELSKWFLNVSAIDISPDMINFAEYKKAVLQLTNITFQVADIEHVPLPFESCTVDFLVASFGMGSLVRDLDLLIDESNRILVPNGVGVFSFYNSNSLLRGLKKPWRPAIAAILSPFKDSLMVDCYGRTFTIDVRSYTMKEVRSRLESRFELLSISTFPMLSSFFAQ